jgi:modulator of FtsH protease HflC
MKKFNILIVILLILGAIVANMVLYVVTETEQVVITQFGKPIGEPVTAPGLHLKKPIIHKVHSFDKRFLEWDGDPNQIPTKDKRFIWVDTYARWRIINPLTFYRRVRDERGAQSRLDDILDGEMRNAIARHDLVEVIRSTNRVPEVTGVLEEELGSGLAIIKTGRGKIENMVIDSAKPRTLELGIELLDVKIKRINYVKEVQQKIYERMRSERKRIAERFRSEGQGQASRILGQKERELRGIRSEAFKKAEEIRGDADAEATEIYALAYNTNMAARSFYAFLKTLETYENVFSAEDTLLLSTDSDFLRYLKTADEGKELDVPTVKKP